MDRRIHSVACSERFYDLFSHRHSWWPSPRIDDDYRVQYQAATYEVIINTLEHLPGTALDAAWGLPELAALHII